MNKHDPRRLARFNRDSIIYIGDVAGFGIWDIERKCFVGFNTTKGLISIWNEPRKAKLAFSYHTNNTIDERSDEFEIRQINSHNDLYGV